MAAPEFTFILGILVGAWVLKLLGTMAFLLYHKRRARRDDAQQRRQRPEGLSLHLRGSYPQGCQPTPPAVLAALPVLTYADALAQQAAAPAGDASSPPRGGDVAISFVDAGASGGGGGGGGAGEADAGIEPQGGGNSDKQAVADSCAICFDEYAPDDRVKRLPCGHIYHPGCIDPWLARDVTCPLCKRAVCELPAHIEVPARIVAFRHDPSISTSYVFVAPLSSSQLQMRGEPPSAAAGTEAPDEAAMPVVVAVRSDGAPARHEAQSLLPPPPAAARHWLLPWPHRQGR